MRWFVLNWPSHAKNQIKKTHTHFHGDGRRTTTPTRGDTAAAATTTTTSTTTTTTTRRGGPKALVALGWCCCHRAQVQPFAARIVRY